MRVLVIDNYDSFVYNLVQYLAQLGAQVTVRRNDEVDLDELDEVEVNGRTEGGVIMAVRHRELPVVGVQFHPESVLTEGGHRLLANWMASAGHPVAEATVEALTAEAAAVTSTA